MLILLLTIVIGNSFQVYSQQAGISNSSTPPPPLYWTEHWLNHNQNLSRVYLDDHVAGYLDDDVEPSVRWPFEYMSKVWRYVKNFYGDFGPDQHLYVILHSGKYSGGHPSYYFQKDHDFRNVIDLGLKDTNRWTKKNDFGDIILLTGVAGLVVEFSNRQTEGSPGCNVWGSLPTMWSEIFIYDILLNLEMSNEAQKYLNSRLKSTVDYPREGTNWMRDWFWPIYQRAGARVLDDFFALIFENFPRVYKSSGSSGDLPHFEYIGGGMNMGEFVHFWSAATNTSLKGMATNAFGWTDEYQRQFDQAKKQYPQLQYSCKDNYNVIYDCFKLLPDERPLFTDIVQRPNDIISYIENPQA